jgi:hypothetical protein
MRIAQHWFELMLCVCVCVFLFKKKYISNFNIKNLFGGCGIFSMVFPIYQPFGFNSSTIFQIQKSFGPNSKIVSNCMLNIIWVQSLQKNKIGVCIGIKFNK